MIDHEAAADGVVVARRQRFAGGVIRGEAHAIAVVRQFLALVEDEIGFLVERDLVLAEQADFLVAADAREARRNRIRIDLVRPFAFESAQHGFVGAVAAPGVRERSEQLAADARDVVQNAALVEPFGDEARGRAHRSHRVRRRRPDADLEQVENADSHAIQMGMRKAIFYALPTAADS